LKLNANLQRGQHSTIHFASFNSAIIFGRQVIMASEGDSVEYESNEEEETGTEEEEEEEEVVVKVSRKKKRGKKTKDPNKPKRNMSAFFLYSNEHRNRVKQENPNIKFGEVAKVLSTEFRALSAKEKKKWDKLAEKDKQRYTEQMESYEPPSDSSDSEGGRKKKKKPKKDPNKPKRNLSAFFIYSNVVRETVRKENPEAKFGDIARIISRQFKALPAEERMEYDEKAAADKERYRKEMESYTPPW